MEIDDEVVVSDPTAALLDQFGKGYLKSVKTGEVASVQSGFACPFDNYLRQERSTWDVVMAASSVQGFSDEMQCEPVRALAGMIRTVVMVSDPAP